MARTDQKLSPSREARQLFGQMVARSQEGHMSLNKTLELAVVRQDTTVADQQLVKELVNDRWVECAPDGGWLVGEFVRFT